MTYSLATPLVLALVITFSRYWSENYGYKSLDFTVDTFFVSSIIELPLFIIYATSTGYSPLQMTFGVTAAISFITG